MIAYYEDDRRILAKRTPYGPICSRAKQAPTDGKWIDHDRLRDPGNSEPTTIFQRLEESPQHEPCPRWNHRSGIADLIESCTDTPQRAQPARELAGSRPCIIPETIRQQKGGYLRDEYHYVSRNPTASGVSHSQRHRDRAPIRVHRIPE